MALACDVKVADENCTKVIQFTFSGLTEHPELQPVLFMLLLGTYALTLSGDLGLIALIRVSPQLHTPSEIYLLAAMAYDWYVAISKPLLHKAVMSPRVCMSLVAGSYLAGLLNAIIHTSALLQLSFCSPLVINNVPLLLVVASTDMHLNEGLMFVFVGFNMMTTSLLILISYTSILVVMGRMGSAASRCKACSTCASHLAAVILFCVSATFKYMQPSSSNSLESKKIAFIFYTL
ncbi:olfactory receptor 8D1-like [Leptosomus discolor]